MEKWTQRKEQNNYSDHLRELNVVKTSNDINVFTFVLSLIWYSFKNQDFWTLNKVIQGTLKKKKEKKIWSLISRSLYGKHLHENGSGNTIFLTT